MTLTDDELTAAFEACSLDPSLFGHREHVRLTWIYLRRHAHVEALQRLTTGLRRYVAAVGAAAKYHETITWAWFALVAERVAADPELGWDAFAAAHPELFESGLLETVYDRETLGSALARRVFVLPR